ncbi:hypothetical protein XU18_2021 [Perkinsela sp. CCAP 1560/4]|nr:hypothetical protein XU18_2021 [Perkinsela sp. CCAP 1560/4]|eukprot:KNH07489.1 hypothetical protein XU18_2021 [Perkinsela sp. CCAP 1560/4]
MDQSQVDVAVSTSRRKSQFARVSPEIVDVSVERKSQSNEFKYNSPEDELLFRFGPTRVTQKDLLSVMSDNGCANDTILDFYIRFIEAGRPNPKAHVFHAQFYSALKQAFGPISKIEKDIFAVHTDQSSKQAAFHRLFVNPSSILNCDVREKCIFNCDALFIPVCLNEHWFTVFITEPHSFFWYHLSLSKRAKLLQRMRTQLAASQHDRATALAQHVFGRPSKKLQSARSAMATDSLSTSSLNVDILPDSPGEYVPPSLFLTCDSTPHESSTRVFFLDSLLHPRIITSPGAKQDLRQRIRAVIRPIALFLIHRWHAELCIALGCDRVLGDSELVSLYAHFFKGETIQHAILCVPQQDNLSLDCGYFTLHWIDILRHPTILRVFVERLHSMEARETSKVSRVFRNVVFNAQLTTYNLFDRRVAFEKRRRVASLIHFIAVKVKEHNEKCGPLRKTSVHLSSHTDPDIDEIVKCLTSPKV